MAKCERCGHDPIRAPLVEAVAKAAAKYVEHYPRSMHIDIATHKRRAARDTLERALATLAELDGNGSN
jgi:hypothetical protein